jgi:hypothetical protein
MRLREEFEPVLISPNGLHYTPELCRQSWDDEYEKHQPWEKWDEVLREEIVKADEWLRLCTRTKQINKTIGTSYGLKHTLEHWWEKTKGVDGYVCNGCFLMAAHRLGFKMKGCPGSYCFRGGFVDDCFNAYLNISSRGMPGGYEWCQERQRKLAEEDRKKFDEKIRAIIEEGRN